MMRRSCYFFLILLLSFAHAHVPMQPLWQTSNSTTGVGYTAQLFNELIIYSASYVYAVGIRDGRLVWTGSVQSTCGASITVSSGIVFVGCCACVGGRAAYALNATNGSLMWSFVISGNVFPRPLVAAGLVFVGSDDRNIYAINASTGLQKWKYTTGGYVRCMPCFHAGIVYFQSCDQYVYAFPASTGGSYLWRTFTANRWNGGINSNPALWPAGGILVVGSQGLKVNAINMSNGAVMWTAIPSQRFVGGVLISNVNSSSSADVTVYVGSVSGNLYALNISTGAVLRTMACPSSIQSTPAIALGFIFIGADNGAIVAFRIDSGRRFGSVQMSAGSNALAQPLIIDNVIYCGDTSGRMHAYRLNMFSGSFSDSVMLSQSASRSRPSASVSRSGWTTIGETNRLTLSMTGQLQSSTWTRTASLISTPSRITETASGAMTESMMTSTTTATATVSETLELSNSPVAITRSSSLTALLSFSPSGTCPTSHLVQEPQLAVGGAFFAPTTIVPLSSIIYFGVVEVRLSGAVDARILRVGNISTTAGAVGVVQNVTTNGSVLAVPIHISGNAISLLSLVNYQTLVVSADVVATRNCLPRGLRTRLNASWVIAPLPPKTPLQVATTAAYRTAAITTSFIGNPATALTTTGVMSMISLASCTFSDSDPLDPSVSPIPFAFGLEMGQYYRGAVVTGLGIYGISAMAVALAACVLTYLTRTCETFTLSLAKLRCPSSGMILVGIFHQGLASSGVSLIRLHAQPGDVALGFLSLASCMAVTCWAAYVTTGPRFECAQRKVRLTPETNVRAHFGNLAQSFADVAVWRFHWVDRSSNYFKRRYMSLFADMQLPWWTAVELSAGVVQGAVLGLRMNSLDVCRGQQIVLAIHSAFMLILCSLLFRPCGATLPQVFLVLSKAAAFLESLFTGVYQLTLNALYSDASDDIVSASMLVSDVQTATQLLVIVIFAVPSIIALVSGFVRRKRQDWAVQNRQQQPLSVNECENDAERLLLANRFSADDNTHSTTLTRASLCYSEEIGEAEIRGRATIHVRAPLSIRNLDGYEVARQTEALRALCAVLNPMCPQSSRLGLLIFAAARSSSRSWQYSEEAGMAASLSQ